MCARGNDTQSSGRNEKISLISRLPVSLVDSHLEGPHPHPPSLISVRPCWEKEGKGGEVQNLASQRKLLCSWTILSQTEQTRLHPEREQSAKSRNAEKRFSSRSQRSPKTESPVQSSPHLPLVPKVPAQSRSSPAPRSTSDIRSGVHNLLPPHPSCLIWGDIQLLRTDQIPVYPVLHFPGRAYKRLTPNLNLGMQRFDRRMINYGLTL